MLGEQAQVAAIETLASLYLRRWPVLMPGQQPPSKLSLAVALDECAGLLAQLGSAPSQVLEAIHDPLLRCLGHPSHRVQVSAAWCMRTLCSTAPTEIGSTLKSLQDMLDKDLHSLRNAGGERAGADLPRRTAGHARGLAAVIDVAAERPLYTSSDVATKVFDLSVSLLKQSGEHGLSISAVEIEVAWTLIGALMSLGPKFAKQQTSQLLSMWRSALPRDADSTTRSDAEWGFLLHVRECTLTSIYAFLVHNGRSTTLDAARRILSLLANSLSFVNNFASLHAHLAQEQVPGQERSSLSLLDREHLVRRRVLQCFLHLAASPALEAAQQESLVAACVQSFAEPERYVGSAAQAAIVASAGNFTTVWNLSDGYAFGLTSLQRDMECFVGGGAGSLFKSTTEVCKPDWLNRDPIEVQLDALARRPILGATEHDSAVLYARPRQLTETGRASLPLPLPPPPATGVVDASIELLVVLLPYQRRETQISTLETLLGYVRTPRLEKNPGRKMAIRVNAAVAVLGTLRVVQGYRVPSSSLYSSPTRSNGTPAGFTNDRITTALRELLQDCLVQQGDPWIRSTAAESFGRLAAVAGPHSMSSQIQFLVDQVVNNRDPDARAGCAGAFGSVYSSIGGLAAGPLTKTVVDILLSLANDPHPTVHYAALEALALVVEAASLGYSAFVASTLGMLARLYMLATHEPEGGSAGSSNLRTELPAHQAICRLLSAIISVLGPDLNEPSCSKVRSLIQVLLSELGRESDAGVVVEATRATQHLALFVMHSQQDVVTWIATLEDHLRTATQRPLRLAAVDALYQLVQRQALTVSKVGGDGLVEELFGLLDSDPQADGVRQVLLSWLRQTASLGPGSWIDLCQRIMSGEAIQRGTSKHKNNNNGTASNPAAVARGLQDEESAAIHVGSSAAQGHGLSARWRTQLFALQCLHEVFVTVRQSGKLEHFATPVRRQQMSSRVVDVIRMAFIASTAANADVRLEGLTVLRDVVDSFKAARDPDFQEALLLEQHQAPIAAALTPAFLSDSTPEVLAAAVQVCAAFVGSGVVKEVDKLGRILRQLTAALDACLQPSMEGLGDVKGLCQNATSMLKLAVFTAWSELQVASVGQQYLVNVVQPHVALLGPAWIESLAEYARSRSDPDGVAGVVESAEEAASLTAHYERSWHKILHAVSVLMGQGDPTLMAAMDGETDVKSISPSHAVSSSFRCEPLLHFYALYGLAFEALVTSTVRGASSTLQHQQTAVALLAVRQLCAPQFAGSALLQEDIFDELVNLTYRLLMTESASVQVRVLDLISQGFCLGYGRRLLDDDGINDADDGDRHRHSRSSSKGTTCLGVILYALKNASRRGMPQSSPEDRANLVRSSLSAYLDAVAAIYPRARALHLYAVLLQAYSDLLRDESSESDLIGPTLASLKELSSRLSSLPQSSDEIDLAQRTIHGFLSSAVNGIDEMRVRSGKVAATKTKNGLLVLTVVLTSLHSTTSITVSQAVLEQFCYQLLQNVGHKTETDEIVSSTTVNCVRMLLARPGVTISQSPAWVRYCIGQLLPTLLVYVISPSLSSSPSGVDITKALVGLVATQEGAGRARMMGIILPALCQNLKRGEEEGEDKRRESFYKITVHHVVSMATMDQDAFRQTASRLEPEVRRLLESSVRSAVQNASTGGRQGQTGGTGVSGSSSSSSNAKTIALKSFG